MCITQLVLPAPRSCLLRACSRLCRLPGSHDSATADLSLAATPESCNSAVFARIATSKAFATKQTNPIYKCGGCQLPHWPCGWYVAFATSFAAAMRTPVRRAGTLAQPRAHVPSHQWSLHGLCGLRFGTGLAPCQLPQPLSHLATGLQVVCDTDTVTRQASRCWH